MCSEVEEYYDAISEIIDQLALMGKDKLSPSQFVSIIIMHASKILRIRAKSSDNGREDSKEVIMDAMNMGFDLGEKELKEYKENGKAN